MKEGTLGNFAGLWVHHRTTNHPLTRHFEADALEGFLCRLVERGDRLAVEIRQNRNINELCGMIFQQNLESGAELIEVRRWDVQIFDFEVVVDLEHQHLPDGVHAFENR